VKLVMYTLLKMENNDEAEMLQLFLEFTDRDLPFSGRLYSI